MWYIRDTIQEPSLIWFKLCDVNAGAFIKQMLLECRLLMFQLDNGIIRPNHHLARNGVAANAVLIIRGDLALRVQNIHVDCRWYSYLLKEGEFQLGDTYFWNQYMRCVCVVNKLQSMANIS
jgi:hypothetical protein